MAYPLFIFFLSIFVVASPTKTYGSFNLSIQKFEFCKGPKQKDCCVASATISNNTTVTMNITVKENVSPTKGKVLATSDDVNDVAIRLHVNKPCEHLFMGPLLQTLFNMTSKCVILKGHYNIHLDVQDLVRSYYGGMHLYGTRIFKSIYYNNDCNFACTYVEVKLTPKNV